MLELSRASGWLKWEISRLQLGGDGLARASTAPMSLRGTAWVATTPSTPAPFSPNEERDRRRRRRRASRTGTAGPSLPPSSLPSQRQRHGHQDEPHGPIGSIDGATVEAPWVELATASKGRTAVTGWVTLEDASVSPCGIAPAWTFQSSTPRFDAVSRRGRAVGVDVGVSTPWASRPTGRSEFGRATKLFRARRCAFVGACPGYPSDRSYFPTLATVADRGPTVARPRLKRPWPPWPMPLGMAMVRHGFLDPLATPPTSTVIGHGQSGKGSSSAGLARA